MNERNVEALEEMIGRHFPPASGVHPSHIKIVARVLAAQGVLVPSVLTMEDANRLAEELDRDVGAGEIVETLEKIAKGEQ